jgi:hypothetical protein
MFGEVSELYSIVGRPNVVSYSYGELRTATENFSCNNLLGEGGYGSVYKVSSSSTHRYFFDIVVFPMIPI